MSAFQEINSEDDNRQKQIPKLEGYQSYKEQFESNVVSTNSYIDQGYSYSDIAMISPIQWSLKQIEFLIEEQNYKINNYFDNYKDKRILPQYSVIGDNSNFDYNHQIEQQNKISLSTVHKAKGLEWKIVFLIGLNDDVIPMSFLRQGDIQSKIEEMRCRFYVGCTRAAEILRLFYFCISNFNGISQESYIKDIGVLIEENNYNFYQKEFSQSQNYRLSDFFDNLSSAQFLNELKASQKFIQNIHINMKEVYNKQQMLSEQQKYAFKALFRKNQEGIIENEQKRILPLSNKIQNFKEFNYLQNMLKSFENKQLSLEKNQQQLYSAIYAACILLQVKKSNQYKYIFNQDPFSEQKNIKDCLLKILDKCFKQQDYKELQFYDEISYKNFCENETIFKQQSSSSQNVPISQQNVKEQNSKQINFKQSQIKQEELSSKYDDSIIDLEQSPTIENCNQKKRKLLHAAPYQQEPNPYKRLQTGNQSIQQFYR
ncbi:hypothetical protein ABPG74_002839 [Tetrahymena malaccensis]